MIATASLLLCIGNTILWIRSYDRVTNFSTERYDLSPNSTFTRSVAGVQIDNGTWYIDKYSMVTRFDETREAIKTYELNPKGRRFELQLHNPPQMGNPWIGAKFNFAGFSCLRGSQTRNTPISRVATISTLLGFPAWAVSLVTAAFPAFWIIGIRPRRRQKRVGYCQVCGYDLTANITGVCSECGTPVVKNAAA